LIIIVAAANTSKINIIIVTVIVYERLNFIYFPILLRIQRWSFTDFKRPVSVSSTTPLTIMQQYQDYY